MIKTRPYHISSQAQKNEILGSRGLATALIDSCHLCLLPLNLGRIYTTSLPFPVTSTDTIACSTEALAHASFCICGLKRASSSLWLSSTFLLRQMLWRKVNGSSLNVSALTSSQFQTFSCFPELLRPLSCYHILPVFISLLTLSFLNAQNVTHTYAHALIFTWTDIFSKECCSNKRK